MHTSPHLGTWQYVIRRVGGFLFGELAIKVLKKNAKHHAISKII